MGLYLLGSSLRRLICDWWVGSYDKPRLVIKNWSRIRLFRPDPLFTFSSYWRNRDWSGRFWTITPTCLKVVVHLVETLAGSRWPWWILEEKNSWYCRDWYWDRRTSSASMDGQVTVINKRIRSTYLGSVASGTVLPKRPSASSFYKTLHQVLEKEYCLDWSGHTPHSTPWVKWGPYVRFLSLRFYDELRWNSSPMELFLSSGIRRS